MPLYSSCAVDSVTSSLAPPQRASSSPLAQSLSIYPRVAFTWWTTSAFPVFFPILSLILIAGVPLAEESLMTMLRGTDLVPVEGWVKSSVQTDLL